MYVVIRGMREIVLGTRVTVGGIPRSPRVGKKVAGSKLQLVLRLQ